VTAYPAEYPLVAAIVSRLNAALGANRAGYGEKPAAAAAATTGYAIVWPGSTALTGGTVVAPNADAVQTVQVTYVGDHPDTADATRDLGRAALLTGVGAALTVSGRTVGLVELVDSQSPRRDADAQPPVWLSVDRYAITTTPA
jgi:hypothetical protein